MQGRLSEAFGVLRGVRQVMLSIGDVQKQEISWWWTHSSVGRNAIESLAQRSIKPSSLGLTDTGLYLVDRFKLMGLQTVITTRALLLHLSDSLYHSQEASPVVIHEASDSLAPQTHGTEPLSPHNVGEASAQLSLQPTANPLSVHEAEVFGAGFSRRKLDIAKERRVPSSRIGRLAGFGNLAFGLGFGAVTEWTKRQIGYPSPEKLSSTASGLFLTEANLERIVDTLCRMRGAALKLGQMLSIQDETVVGSNIQKIFERVRQAADFMPTKQMNRVLVQELGPDWSTLLANFEERPFAAASIGQVHRAVLHDGRQVAMKIQYPGVADSIDADVDNLMSLLSRFNVLPRGLYADRAVEVAKRELRDECDYKREAAFTKLFAGLLASDPVFQVPSVIDELTTKRVLTAEYMEGLVLDDCCSLPQDIRNWLGGQLLRLCLKEVFTFNVMQTDPNWSNFLYNPKTGRIILLDFGASRGYSKEFVDVYIQLIHCAAEGDREGILQHSHTLGFLTGYESKVMIQAHVDAVDILGEAFSSPNPFDFGHQSTTKRINHLIPVMLEHRLSPPPDESYSLHRKMSGCFLLCGKLKAVVDCRPLFYDIWNAYQFGPSNRNLDELLAIYQ